MGTTNDVASTLGLPKNATDAALRIVTGTPTAFDVGSFGDKSFLPTWRPSARSRR